MFAYLYEKRKCFKAEILYKDSEKSRLNRNKHTFIYVKGTGRTIILSVAVTFKSGNLLLFFFKSLNVKHFHKGGCVMVE